MTVGQQTLDIKVDVTAVKREFGPLHGFYVAVAGPSTQRERRATLHTNLRGARSSLTQRGGGRILRIEDAGSREGEYVLVLVEENGDA